MLADASENETLIAVGTRGDGGSEANLYISGSQGLRYTLALGGIVYNNKDDGINQR